MPQASANWDRVKLVSSINEFIRSIMLSDSFIVVQFSKYKDRKNCFKIQIQDLVS